MSDRRQVWETLARLLQRVETSATTLSATASDSASLGQEIRKMSKTQHKANLLAEEQSARVKQALALTQAAQEQNARLLATLSEAQVAAAQRDTLEAILPTLDGIEHAIASGKRYLQTRDLAAHRINLTPQQAVLVSPADRAILSGWLDGLNLVRERLLLILETNSVTPIPSVGEPFNPYLHIAVGTSAQLPAGMNAAANLIIAEERRGYCTPSGVIRFADVIVYRPK